MVNGEFMDVNGEGIEGKALSQAAIGRVLGLAPSTMTKHKAAGMPMHSVEAARAWHKAHTNIAQRKPAPKPKVESREQANFQSVGGDEFTSMIRAHHAQQDCYALGEDFDTARTREKIATANLAEIEEAALRGTYIVKAEFERHLFNAGRMLRDNLTNCARRIGAEVSGLTTAEECEAVIDREHRAALSSFAQALRHSVKIDAEVAQ